MMNKHFALLYHIQRSRPIIEIHTLHAIERISQSLGRCFKSPEAM